MGNEQTLFHIGSTHAARRIDEAGLPTLQAFFDANPEYFQQVFGEPALPDEARQEFEDRPPAGMPFESLWLIGFFDKAGQLDAIASVTGGFFHSSVWHLGLFIVATLRHGDGLGSALYAALEGWIRDRQGAQWLRLGVVIGNQRGVRFWQRQGFRELRQRGPVPMRSREQSLSVMMKPLAGGADADYLVLVQRDRPDSAST